ncbi:10738_t:CDS:2, partial [Dentiscutata erythropus]
MDSKFDHIYLNNILILFPEVLYFRGLIVPNNQLHLSSHHKQLELALDLRDHLKALGRSRLNHLLRLQYLWWRPCANVANVANASEKDLIVFGFQNQSSHQIKRAQ